MSNDIIIIIVTKVLISVTLPHKTVTGALYSVNGHSDRLTTMSLRWCDSCPSDDLNSSSFSDRQKAVVESVFLICEGRLFHARTAAAGNARSPLVDWRVDGITSVDVDADRRRWRAPTPTDSCSISTRYGDAVP